MAIWAFVVSLLFGTDAQIALRGSVVQRGVGPAASSKFGIVMDGDSLTETPTVAQSYPSVVRASVGRFNTISNVGVSGYATTDIAAHLSSVVVPQLQAFGSRRKIYTLLIGTNDGFGGYATIVGTICPAVVAEGAQMVILTGLPWNNTGWETARATYNTAIRNGANGAGGNCVYTVADIASDARMGDTGDNLDTTYYADGTHPAAAGAVVMASYVTTAIQALGVQ